MKRMSFTESKRTFKFWGLKIKFSLIRLMSYFDVFSEAGVDGNIFRASSFGAPDWWNAAELTRWRHGFQRGAFQTPSPLYIVLHDIFVTFFQILTILRW